jgi:RecJ-like exonuclease
LALLKKLDIPNKKGKKFRTLSDLDMEEKMRIFGELNRMLTLEVPAKYSRYVPLLVSGDIFEFIKEERYTPLRNASEFSTAVNACSRNKNPLIAFKVLKGDRGLALDDMDNLTYKHRRYLAEQMGKLEENNQITALSHLQYFDGNEIKTEVIGTIAGMILSYGDWKKPMVAFTEMGEEKEGLKVSLRCSRLLAYDGIHFGNLIQKVAAKVGGSGGGHSVACGAYIPTSSKDRFLKIFNDVIKNQNKIT